MLVSESIQQSLFLHKQPIFLLFLDARSAFDNVFVKFLVRNLYNIGMDGNSLLYIKNRLSHRKTYLEWDKEILGPIDDEQGLEQGGCSSSDLYKFYNNELLSTVQKLDQGVDLGDGVVVSAVGQDDHIA